MNDLTLKNIENLINGSEKRIVKQNQDYVGQAISASEKRIVKQNQDYVGQAVDAILNGVQTMFNERDAKIDKLEKGLADVKRDVGFMHQDLKDIVTETSDKPSRRQFEEFKSKFDNFISA